MFQIIVKNMVYNETTLVITVSHCNINFHMLYVEMLLGNSKCPSVNSSVTTSDLEILICV
jgi:uncharacterized protein (UPF0212 family)